MAQFGGLRLCEHSPLFTMTSRERSRSPAGLPAEACSNGPIKDHPKFSCCCGKEARCRTYKPNLWRPGYIFVSATHAQGAGGCGMELYDVYSEYWEACGCDVCIAMFHKHIALYK